MLVNIPATRYSFHRIYLILMRISSGYLEITFSIVFIPFSTWWTNKSVLLNQSPTIGHNRLIQLYSTIQQQQQIHQHRHFQSVQHRQHLCDHQRFEWKHSSTMHSMEHYWYCSSWCLTQIKNITDNFSTNKDCTFAKIIDFFFFLHNYCHKHEYIPSTIIRTSTNRQVSTGVCTCISSRKTWSDDRS